MEHYPNIYSMWVLQSFRFNPKVYKDTAREEVRSDVKKNLFCLAHEKYDTPSLRRKKEYCRKKSRQYILFSSQKLPVDQ